MKFCWKCGAQLNDADAFCNKCGAKAVMPDSPEYLDFPVTTVPTYEQPPVIQQQAPFQEQFLSATSFTTPQQPPEGMALLFVTCNGTSSNPSIMFFNGRKVIPDSYAKPGVNRQLLYEPGSYVLKYQVDRGPGLTVVSARMTTYTKAIIFHPNEIVSMNVVVGRNVTHISFTSNQGYAIQ